MTKEEKREYMRKYNKEYREKNAAQIKKDKHAHYLKNKPTILAKNKKWREENNDKKKESDKKYRDSHKDEMREYFQQYYIDHQKELLEYQKKNREENKEKIAEYMKKYSESPATYNLWFDRLYPYYGDERIRQDPKDPKLIQIKCYRNECGNWFNPTNKQVSHNFDSINGRGTGWNELYCSDECKEKCPVFGKRSDIDLNKQFEKNANREAQPELREMVLERDNNTCQKCGKSKAEFPNMILHCHHKFPINEDPVCSADIDNCITLCVECHKWVHQNIPGCGYAELRCSET